MPLRVCTDAEESGKGEAPPAREGVEKEKEKEREREKIDTGASGDANEQNSRPVEARELAKQASARKPGSQCIRLSRSWVAALAPEGRRRLFSVARRVEDFIVSTVSSRANTEGKGTSIYFALLLLLFSCCAGGASAPRCSLSSLLCRFSRALLSWCYIFFVAAAPSLYAVIRQRTPALRILTPLYIYIRAETRTSRHLT